VESAPGAGSTFRFTAQFGIQGLGSRAARAPAELTGLRVLAVDDNATNRAILREMLADTGLLVREAAGAEEGLAELRRAQGAGEPYSLILLDGRMPGMSGLEAAAAVRQDTGLTGVIVMMLTSDRGIGDIERCRELGVSTYLMKPVKRRELLNAIAGALGMGTSAALPPAPRGGQREAGPRPLRLLLAEDSVDNRLVVQFYLQDTAHVVDTVSTGIAAVEKFASAGYDLVLMDLQMPDMDGYAATRAIRELERKEGRVPVPIIALSAYALTGDIERSLAAGCTAHLAKPIRKPVLLDAIAAHTSLATGRLEAAAAPAAAGLEDAIPVYLARRREDLNALRAALAQDDFETVRVLGHRMKGSGAAYGFETLTRIGSELETMAMGRDLGGIRRLLDELSDCLQGIGPGASGQQLAD